MSREPIVVLRELLVIRQTTAFIYTTDYRKWVYFRHGGWLGTLLVDV